MADPERTRRLMSEIIENQMREDNPPEVKQTYDRLISEGHSREDTMKLLNFVLLA